MLSTNTTVKFRQFETVPSLAVRVMIVSLHSHKQDSQATHHPRHRIADVVGKLALQCASPHPGAIISSLSYCHTFL